MTYNDCVNFSEFITEKYVLWRGKETGNKKSISRYARDELGITPQLLSEWMNRGKVPTEEKYIKLLIEKFGDSVFEFLPSDAQLKPLAELIMSLPENKRPASRQIVMKAIEEFIKLSKEG
jgi:hypothetical protein